MALLDVEHLEGGTLADVIDVLLIGEAVEAHATVVGDAVRLHNLVDALQHEDGLVVVGLHTLVNDLGQLGIVAHEEPGVNRDAVAAHAGAGLEDIYTGVHVADLDDFIHIHVVVTADAAELIGKGDVHGTVGVLHHLGHLGRADVGHHNLALAEAGVVLLHALSNLAAVGTDGAIVVQQLVHHVARDDTLRSVNEVDVLTNLEAVGLNHRAHELIDGAGRDGALDDHGGALGAHLHHFLDGSHHIAGVHLLGELVIGRRHGDNVRVRLLILGGEADARLHCGLEQLVQSLLLERGLARIQRSHQFLVIVRTNDLHTVRSHHQSSGQSNIAQSNYVNHFCIT